MCMSEGKILKYEVWKQQRRVQDVDFHPLVFETFGCIGPKSLYLVNTVASRAALEFGTSEASERNRWLDLLSTGLALCHAEALLAS